MEKELLAKWAEYTKYLFEHDEVPSYNGGYFNFYWFMTWLELGHLPGKRFAPKEKETPTSEEQS